MATGIVVPLAYSDIKLFSLANMLHQKKTIQIQEGVWISLQNEKIQILTVQYKLREMFGKKFPWYNCIFTFVLYKVIELFTH